MKTTSKLCFSIAAILSTTMLAAIASLKIDVTALPEFDQIKAQHPASDAQLLDRNGHVIQTRRVNYALRSLPWTSLQHTSGSLREAIIAAEDKRFYEHDGIDWRASLVALWQTGTGQFKRGASTITMQLASSMAPELAGRSGGRTMVQKWRQLRIAHQLERAWTKSQILEAYINRVDYRGELHGIAAAALGLFEKAPSGLNIEESAILAALLRAPNATPKRVATRACQLLNEHDAACERVNQLSKKLASPKVLTAQINHAPSLGRLLLTDAAHPVRTTVDYDLQRDVRALLQKRLQQLQHKNVRDASALVLDNVSGDVLAYVGNGGRYASAHHIDGVQAARQAGSTLKPFLYGLAIEQRLQTAASIIEDSPLSLPTAAGLYTPQNYDRRFRGKVTLRNALAGSLNIPAVRTLDLIGPEPFAIHLNQLGYAGLTESGEHYGHSLALGSAEVTLLEQANAYRTLANGGKHGPVRLTPTDPTRPVSQIITPETSYIVADILADRSARATAFGLSNALDTTIWSAVKTGTSKDMRDNWCIGFSHRFTVAVWVGNFNGEPMHDVSGITGAGPLWNDIINRLHHRRPATSPAPPPNLLRAKVKFEHRIESREHEWFLPGTESGLIKPAPTSVRNARILYPAEGSILAIDPDIPAAHQRVFLRATSNKHTLTWHLNGKRLLQNNRPSWRPVAGTHRLALQDNNGNELHAVRFEVR